MAPCNILTQDEESLLVSSALLFFCGGVSALVFFFFLLRSLPPSPQASALLRPPLFSPMLLTVPLSRSLTLQPPPSSTQTDPAGGEHSFFWLAGCAVSEGFPEVTASVMHVCLCMFSFYTSHSFLCLHLSVQ